jgi:hyperosmotically inducible periplasmic protein
MKRNSLRMLGATATLLALAALAGASTGPAGPNTDAAIAAKAVHEIRMYSRYTIWDNINLQVNNGALVLTGQVSQPFKKQDLQRIMQAVPGVSSVTNQLEVLPLSNFDDNLRLRVARAVYGSATFTRYAMQALPPIHIIVNNGHVSLEGVVSTEFDKNMAGMRASSAGLSFGPVENNLRVENPAKPKS